MRDVAVTKTWVTVGDERVRPAHVAADDQIVNINQPFRVGGELLFIPGDTSLGATVGNVIRCRCAAVTDKGEVFAIRREQGELPFLETTATEQLLTSLGG